MNSKKFIALGALSMLGAAALVGCDKKSKYTEFTMFSAMEGSELNPDNDIQNIIAEKTGVRVKETWLTGQTAEEAVGSIIASGKLPDFIDGGNGMTQLYAGGYLVAWDPYLEKYPNLKEMYSDAEWENFRQSDGKIYWANVFNNTYGAPKAPGHNDEAFWIQVRVLEWAGYPEIKTLDEYFDLIERYYKENPTFTDPTGAEVPIIPYTVQAQDWLYFALENPPQFLDGYPNDGSVIVERDTGKVIDYNTTDTAKAYFKKMNEEYQKGIIDKEFATQNHDQYIQKLSKGQVLGICDQNWDFNYDVQPALKTAGLDELGCEYIPLGLTIDGKREQRWHTYGDTLNASSGCAVTTSCKDPDKAFKFLSDILEQEIHDLRYWGVKDVDYLVDENGVYYRTQEMRDKQNDTAYKASHMCQYSYMPQWLGTSRDGINAMQPQEQPIEFRASFSKPLATCFDKYGAEGYPDLIGSVIEENTAWFPMWSYSNELKPAYPEDAADGSHKAGDVWPAGVAWENMGKCKHEWLPKLVMSEDFDSDWEAYMADYKKCKPEDFLNEMQEVVQQRIDAAK
ncbi:MAG: sugar ABC transporter substrate-binding protein [Lachnospiraceae bacterium]|nr:sugar ABC transporter substrate-binding protein [Lachnospiraceae bacterium]